MDVGERIKQRRKQLGISAEALAEQLGVSPATIYRYESNDIMNMRIDKLEPIAKALQTTPAYLMGWDRYEDILIHNELLISRDALKGLQKLAHDYDNVTGVSAMDAFNALAAHPKFSDILFDIACQSVYTETDWKSIAPFGIGITRAKEVVLSSTVRDFKTIIKEIITNGLKPLHRVKHGEEGIELELTPEDEYLVNLFHNKQSLNDSTGLK